MSKRVTNHNAERVEPEIFVTLIKVKASECIQIDYERDGLTGSQKMEDAKKQRPVAEFYTNMQELAYCVRKQAELPDQATADVRCTGIRITYDGVSRKPSAQLIGWR